MKGICQMGTNPPQSRYTSSLKILSNRAQRYPYKSCSGASALFQSLPWKAESSVLPSGQNLSWSQFQYLPEVLMTLFSAPYHQDKWRRHCHWHHSMPHHISWPVPLSTDRHVQRPTTQKPHRYIYGQYYSQPLYSRHSQTHHQVVQTRRSSDGRCPSSPGTTTASWA